MSTEVFYFGALSLLALGAASAFVPKVNIRIINFLAHGFAALGSIAGVLCAFFVFIAGPWEMTFSLTKPIGDVSVKIDYLSALFVGALGLVGAAASVYAIGYSQEYYGQRYRQLAALFNAFLASMYLVLAADHIFLFLSAWELMAIFSFFLVAHDDSDRENSRAAYIYVIMTHVGTAFLITAFFLLAAAAGDMSFSRLGTGVLDNSVKNLVFLCTVIGFGTKAGVMPLHIWLPRAHPVAPSHVSALMSGIMIKTAIYGMARFYLDFLGSGPIWWGAVILFLAAISAVLGVLYALMENDLKRLLAYSSVENIGLILMGMGTGMIFASKGSPVLAGIAWTAALYHTVSHAVFKSLLFLGAGSVVYRTHSKNIEQLGGLIKLMPYTGAAFLAGAAAISALPPLSGFVSEWLTFQSLFLLPSALPSITAKVAGACLIALFGLTGALAAACFVKAFGITFLAKPRSAKARHATEVPKSMWIPTAFLAALCVVLGMWPQLLMQLIAKIFIGRTSVDASLLLNQSWLSIGWQADAARASFTPAVAAALIAVGLAASYFMFRLTGRPVIASGETWTCGIVPTARMEYTGTGFSKPVRTAFRAILRPQREVLVHEGGKYHGRKLSYQLSIRYLLNELYRPLNRSVIRLAFLMRRMQTGSVQLYVGYIAVVTVLALLWNAWWSN